jgi:hypothetical protein
MNEKLAWLADSIKIAILDDVEIFFHKSTTYKVIFVLKKGGRPLAGTGLTDLGGWWRIDSLWSISAPATMGLLYATLKKVEEHCSFF